MACKEFNSMVGFSREELRTMLTYYREQGAFTCPVDDVIEAMKPNYDNYYFSKDRLNDCMFNSDMALYFLNSYIHTGVIPEEIVDPNIRTDFNKLAYLVRLDRGLEDNFSVIKQIAEKGELVTHIATHFSALEMMKPENIKSLLFYFGLLSIKGVTGLGTPVLHVPNMVVREQLFRFLLDGYAKHDIFQVDTYRIETLMMDMALNADWKPLFEYLADAIRRQGRIRAVPVYPPYTFLLEVKYCKAGSSDAEVRTLADEARQ